MYQSGDKTIEVKELLLKAFASAWEQTDHSTDRDSWMQSCLSVIDSLQVSPEIIYGEEGQGLLDATLDHLDDQLRTDGVWIYYAVPAESFFLVTWMPDPQSAADKVNALRQEGGCLACIVDLTQQWQVHDNTPQLNII